VQLEPYLREALEGKAVSAIEVCSDPGANGEGTDPTLLYSCQPAFDEVGDVIGISLSALEITQWKRISWQRDVHLGSCNCVTQLSFESR